ncbi:MAG: PAS domain-containing protein [Planctomycetota bacterium]
MRRDDPVETKVRHAIDGCAALANNDIVVNSIIDVDHRQSTLQPFIQSLDFPGSPVHNIAMLAYDGTVIAQKLPQDERLEWPRDWLVHSGANQPFLALTSKELVVAQPVRYAAGVEGALVVVYDSRGFFDDLALGNEHLETRIYYQDDLLTWSSSDEKGRPAEKPANWFTSNFGVSELPGLVGEIWQSDCAATQASAAVRNSMSLVLVFISLVLLLGLWLPAEFTIQQIRKMLQAIVDVRSNGELSLRLNSGRIAEFRQLQDEFNEMLANLERSTVSRELYRIPALVAQFTDNGVIVTDAFGRIEWVNEAFQELSGYSLDEVLGKTPGSFLQGPLSDPAMIELMRRAVANQEAFDVEIVNYSKSGEAYWVSIESRPIHNDVGELINFIAIESDITLRRQAEEENARLASEMLRLSREAGMAEVATGVLHNVGNVLNSVNTSASTIDERLRSPKRRQLDRVIGLLECNRENLGDYLTKDSRGTQVPELLTRLAETLESEDEELIQETRALAKNVDHIKAIIATQQSFAGSRGIRESFHLNEVLENALQINRSMFANRSIEIRKSLSDLPELQLDKQQVLQIAVNLTKNAMEALMQSDSHERVFSLRSFLGEDCVIVEFVDNGVGIAPDKLTEIFGHGYTTKKTGHGFGLHSCANSAQEMGGKLTASSEGVGFGATFTLTLPLDMRDSSHAIPNEQVAGAER